MPRDLRPELFAERIAEAIGDNVLEFARRAGLLSIQRSIANWKANPASIKPENLILIAKAADRPIAWFFGEDPPASVIIPVLDVRASAGPGCVADVVKAESEFPFPLHFLLKLMGDAAYSARLESLRASGDSMEPTIVDGALLIIDRIQNRLPDSKPNGKKYARRLAPAGIYVFYQGDAVRLKRLRQIDEDRIAILSDNEPEHPAEMFHRRRDGAFEIIGKVIWWDNRL